MDSVRKKDVEVSDQEAVEWFMEKWAREILMEQEGKEPEYKIVMMTEKGTVVLTPKQMLEEMKKGTEIGIRHIGMIKKYLKWVREKEGGEDK